MRLRGPAGAGAVWAMVAVTLMWGATFVVVRDSLGHLAPAALVAFRFAAAAAVLAVALLIARRPLTRGTLAGGVVTGVATAGGYWCQAIGLTHTSAGSSAFLTCSGTLLAGLFAWPLLHQRPSGWLISGLLMAMSGAAVLTLRGRPVGTFGIGEAWTLLGALIYALQIVGVAHWAPRTDPVALAGVQAAVVAIGTWPAAGNVVGQLETLDAVGWARLAYLVVCGSVAAPLLQVLAQRRLSPGRVGLLFALEPVFALGFALTVGGERFVASWWAGSALILAAVVLVEWHAARAGAARTPPSTAGSA